MIAAEDSLAAQRLTETLENLQFEVRQFQIPISGEWDPVDGAIAICGPKSSRITAEAIESDPWLSFQADDNGRWVIRDRETGQALVSPLDRDTEDEDIAYVGRLAYQGGTLFVIAGVHAMGSLGAVDVLGREHGRALRASRHSVLLDGGPESVRRRQGDRDRRAVASPGTPVKVVDAATLKGDGSSNQDRYLVGDYYAAVFDGASAFPPEPSDRDGGWYARELAKAVQERMAPSGDLRGVLKDALEDVLREHDLRADGPSSTVALVRWDDVNLDCLVLGDSPIAVMHRRWPCGCDH